MTGLCRVAEGERSGDSMKNIQKGINVYESPLLSPQATIPGCHPEAQRGISIVVLNIQYCVTLLKKELNLIRISLW
jgi:hypothetical protein